MEGRVREREGGRARTGGGNRGERGRGRAWTGGETEKEGEDGRASERERKNVEGRGLVV